MNLCEEILRFLSQAPILAQEMTMEQLETHFEMVPPSLQGDI